MKPRGNWSGNFSTSGLIILTLGLGVVGGVAMDRVATDGLGPLNKSPSFSLMEDAWSIIGRFYVDRAALKPRAMTYGAISGMIDSLGDTGHSRFLSPGMVKALTQIERDKLQGIGAEIQLKDGHVVIVAPLDGSPAQRAGLRHGDIILRVNNAEVTGLPLDQVVEKISGTAGTSVTLTILEISSGRTRQISLERAAITIHNVTWQMLPDTKLGHLRISSFNRGAAEDVREALTRMKQEGATGIVLDLRDNPGGLLDEAVSAASQFLKGGNVLLVKNARGQETPIPVKPGGLAPDTPLVVLVNGGTASGAEIMAGALQDACRARLVGETTIGTGTVLNEFPLPDGSALLLAVEEWLTPDGHVIWHKGIAPNIVVALPANDSPLFPEMERHMTAEQFRQSDDRQLARAIEELKDHKTES
ncbi:MAG TPA: S41 family peptidase [Verrucomicrobiae bacterium]|nr:S41 family peptidase [Verrucomicrobiae bacterium]